MDIYDIFFSICLGLFIGGLILSIVSFILAEASAQDHDFDHMDHMDHIDHIDHLDHVDHMDYIDHVDHIDHMDHPDHFDHADSGDHIDHDKDFQVDSQVQESITPAPFMLLLSSALLVFGISGITSYYLIIDILKFLIFIIAPVMSILTTKLISTIWKKIAISRHYSIASTENLIGKEGEVVLEVDNQGGVIKIPSNNPMRFEKLHVKPFEPDDVFKKQEKVVIVGVKNGYLLINKIGKIYKKNIKSS